MANRLNGETAIKTAMLYLERKGFQVEWSGLCVWAYGAKARKGSDLDKALRTIGAAYSDKRRGYFLRADDSAGDLPKRGAITIHQDEAA